MEGLFVPVAFFAAVFGIVYVIVAARNKERLAMIERGVDMTIFNADKRSYTYIAMKLGLLFIGIGLGVFIGSFLEIFTVLYEGQAITSLSFIFGGLGLVTGFLIEKKVKSTL